jgi:putative colanic acid biosynthesis acetyltransferase WcaF
MHPKYQNLKEYHYNLKRGKSNLTLLLFNFCYKFCIRPTPRLLFKWRNFVYRLFGAKIGIGVRISNTAKLLYPWNVVIGNYCWIGENCTLYSIDKIEIGNNVALAHNIFISTASHDLKSLIFETIRAPVKIYDEVWISSNAFINMGVRINRGAVIGSCAVVTKDMPEGYICLGFPAKPVRLRKPLIEKGNE